MAESLDELKRRLAAAQKTVSVLVERIASDEALERVAQGDAARAIAGLEAILRRRSQDLRESEARYRVLFDRSPDMVLTVDQAGRVTEANARSCDILGDLVRPGAHLDGLFDDNTAPDVLFSVLSGPGGGVLGELHLVDGRKVSLSASQIPALDGLTQVVLRDVSAQRALEEELHQSRRLAAVGHLAAGVAHEINNPLAVMRLRLDVLGTRALPEEVVAPMEVLGRQVDRIARIVRSLQSFAKTQTLTRENLLVVDVVEGAMEASAAGLDGTAVLVDIPADLAVSGDRVQLEQVVTNLLVNASRAMGGSGLIELAAKGDGEQVVLEVCDQGPGVSDEVKADLFTPFVSGAEGMGLGLAICWAIVEEHGGTIRWTNREAGGAIFSVVLPVALPEVEHTDESLAPVATQGLTVLVVDDEPEILSLLSAFLAAAGHRAVVAASAEDAYETIEQRSDLDVLVTDVHLPGRSGLDLLHELEALEHPLAGRTIVMSGLFHRPEGEMPYLQKPFRRTNFLAALDALVG